MTWLAFRRSKTNRETDDELRFHIEARAADLERSGVPPAEALRCARLEFGGYQKFREECHEALGAPFLETLIQDTRYAVRMLRKSPGFTVVALLTLTLGIGANTAIFSYVNAWLIKPLPYPEPNRLMVLFSHDTKRGWTSTEVSSTADFVDIQRQNTVFEQLAAWTSWQFNLTSDGPPDRVDGGLVSWNFFQTLGVRPILGRAFIPQEAQPGSSRVAILSRGLWESRFAADPHIVGRKIVLQGASYTVVGVMPSGFQFPLMGAANIWAPLALDDQQRADRRRSWFSAFGRLKPGVTQTQAAAEVATIASTLEKLYPQTNTNLTSLLSPLAYEIGKEEGTEQVMISFCIVGLVLLIACANVANLMLARAARQTKEFAVRAALGASRSRLVRQLLTETILLFIAGGAAGTLFAAWAIHWIGDSIPPVIRGYLVNYGRVEIDTATLTYTLAVAFLCGALFGLAPAFENSRLDLTRALKEAAGKISGSTRAARMRRTFVVAEIALAVVVLISTTLLVKSFAYMVYDGLGFQPQNVIVTQLVVPPNKYTSNSQVRNFYDRALARIRALPEVASVGASEYIPFGQSNQVEAIHVVGRPAERPGEEIGAQYSAATAEYFSTMRIPLLRGRVIEPQDGPGSPSVVVINETLMRQMFPNENPIGRQLQIGRQHAPWTIVGVVHDVKQFTLADEPERQLYVSAAQFPSPYTSIVVRASRPAPQLPAGVRDAIWSVDREQPVSSVRTLDDLITEQNTPNRVLVQLTAFFGILALSLGAIGIYGVMAHSVAQRVHEIGIRMALGASADHVVRMVLQEGLKLALVGIVVGMFAAVGTNRALAPILYKVKPSDPLAFGLVAAFFTLVAFAASYIPARRGASVDPMVALRNE